MKKVAWIAFGLVAPILINLMFTVGDALAGPPLLCHAIEIGDAESLTWGNGTWDNGKIELSDEDFVSHTLALLPPDADVLTRMETIRRATIHAAEHPKAAKALLAAVRLRVANDEKPDANLLFDLGYLMATYSQMNIVTEHNSVGTTGAKRQALPTSDDPSPYSLIKKAAGFTPENGAIEFALALITMSPTHPSHREHVQRAVAGASAGSLLATNLVKRFGREGQSLADLRVSYGSVGNGERR